MDIVSEITLNEKFNNDSVKNSLKERWLKKERYSDAVVDLDSDPFRVCVINEFLNEADIINNIIDNMNTLDWSRKTMDLYEFHRTDDLSSLTWQRGIKAMYELLKGDAMKWVTYTDSIFTARDKY